MKEKFERFKNEQIVVNVRSQKQYDDFMKMCEEQGLKWYNGDLPTEINFYNDYEEEICIKVTNLTRLTYCNINSYKNDGYKIITYKDFMKEEPKQFTKSDLKENHIVKNRGNHKFMWGDRPTDTYNSDLTNIYDNILDIMEVWEFDKLVWKREEKPVEILDEVEKRWLNHFIKSTNIKVDYIVKYNSIIYNDREYLQICYNVNGIIYSTIFPFFKKDTMYQGMELDKEYTLEELGLED